MENLMSVISQFSSGGVKSVQSGVASAAGTATISSVNVAKSVVYSVSKGSAGTVAARGTITQTSNGTISGDLYTGRIDQSGPMQPGTGGGSVGSIVNGTVNLPTQTLSGGTTDLTTKQYSARLTNATTITVDGPCEWQVVEYY